MRTVCFLDLLRTPFGRSPVECPALFDHVVERADNFLHGD